MIELRELEVVVVGLLRSFSVVFIIIISIIIATVLHRPTGEFVGRRRRGRFSCGWLYVYCWQSQNLSAFETEAEAAAAKQVSEHLLSCCCWLNPLNPSWISLVEQVRDEPTN